MTDFTPEQQEKIFKLAEINATILWWIIVALVLFLIFIYIAKAIKQNKYYGTLTAEERDVIYKYNNVKIFERKHSHDPNNSNNNTSNN